MFVEIRDRSLISCMVNDPFGEGVFYKIVFYNNRLSLLLFCIRAVPTGVVSC